MYQFCLVVDIAVHNMQGVELHKTTEKMTSNYENISKPICIENVSNLQIFLLQLNEIGIFIQLTVSFNIDFSWFFTPLQRVTSVYKSLKNIGFGLNSVILRF